MSTPTEPNDLGKAMLLMAELQQKLLTRFPEEQKPPKPKTVGSVKLTEFRGGRQVSTKDYRQWRKSAMAHMQLHQMTQSEKALLIYLSCTGEA